jgi:hypothetical protein
LLLQALVTFAPLSAVTALQIQPVKGGVLLLDQATVYREAAHVEVFITVDSDEDRDRRRRSRDLLARSATQVLNLVQRHDNASTFGTLITTRLKRYTIDDAERRPKRGLINLVGDLASTLFSTARQEDLDKLSRALGALHQQTQSFVRLDQQRLAAIDTLAANQEAIAQQLATTLNNIEGQDIQLRQMGRVLQEQASHLHQLEMRQRMALLAEVLSDDADALNAVDCRRRRHDATPHL